MAIANQCENCDKYMAEFGVCYDTRIEPNYNGEECLRFREKGMSAPAPAMIKRSFPGLLDLYLWVVLGLGSVSKSMLLVGSLVKGQVHNWMTCCDALFKLFTIILSVYTLFAFIKRKPDAIALAKAQLIIQLALMFVITVSNLVVDFSTAILVRNVLTMAWNAFLLWYICTSDQVSACIPTENRGLMKRDVIIIVVVCATYGLCILLALVASLLG